MNVRIESSKIVKPLYDAGGGARRRRRPARAVTYDVYMAVIYAFRPPTPPNAALELGLAKTLAVYREWAGELADGGDAVLLNDRGGALFVEAAVSAPLAAVMPCCGCTRAGGGRAGRELVRVQLTRFACGSLVIGFTSHHRVAYGQAAGNFLVAWGLASRRLPVAPLPVCDRATRFPPRHPPLVQFPHRDTEYYAPKKKKKNHDAGAVAVEDDDDELATVAHDKIKVHFTKEFVAGACVVVAVAVAAWVQHVRERGRPPLARGLAAGEATTLRVSVNGRTRMRPAVPRGYFGNLVLWAFPRCAAGELASRPVQHAAKLIRRAVARADDAYFRSFVDFASSGAVEAEGLAATADESQAVLCPDVEVDSWLGIDFYELDFGGGGGGGGPFYFTPSYLPMEGTVFLVPSFAGDGGIDAYVALFETHLDEFKKICYTY
uniref:Uncharacterized protein n=1 Tax=Oryza sativa subsp. japonica TaxID=39947 RepID=Q5W7D0_ORYSJ|nr:hypothetical protein [Oryza sativa Japonica Group]